MRSGGRVSAEGRSGFQSEDAVAARDVPSAVDAVDQLLDQDQERGRPNPTSSPSSSVRDPHRRQGTQLNLIDTIPQD